MVITCGLSLSFVLGVLRLLAAEDVFGRSRGGAGIIPTRIGGIAEYGDWMCFCFADRRNMYS